MLDALDLSDVFMIGWSMGGGVTFSYFQNFGSHRLRAVDLPPWSWSIPNVRVWIVKGGRCGASTAHAGASDHQAAGGRSGLGAGTVGGAGLQGAGGDGAEVLPLA